MGAYFDHGTWRTPGPQFTPLRVTPADPAAAAAVMPFGTAIWGRAPEGPFAVPPAGPPEGPPPATVVSVEPAATPPWSAPCPNPPLSTVELLLGVTLGTMVTTRRRTARPISSGV